MPERRKTSRQDTSERRSFPRPPLWLNLLILLLGVAGLAVVHQHRQRVSKRFAAVISEQQRTPGDVNRIKDELAGMNLSRGQLQQQLDAKMKFAQSLNSQDFYLSVDTTARKLRFYYGDTVLRESDITPGESTTIRAADGHTWTFVPVKGAFPVEAKVVDYEWPVPDWVYAMNHQSAPQPLPVVRDGLGKYVLFLPNGYVIHSPPSADSPLKGPKPGSFMVSEEDLKAIWPRVHKDQTQVYIF